MAYSDKDLESTYESLVNTVSTEVQVWRSGAVYFDDEVVEYQGKLYVALGKTSSDVPGRSKSGIWKEVKREEEEVFHDTDEEDLYYEEPLSEEDHAPIHNTGTTRTVQRKEDDTQPVTPRVSDEGIKASVAKIDKSVPSSKNNTPPVMQDQGERKKSINTVEKRSVEQNRTGVVEKNTPKVMKAVPNEQSLVNTVLKGIDFNKIKGANLDENSIVSDLILSETVASPARVVWNSSHPEIISPRGKVNRPDDGNDIAVNLSVTVSINASSATRFYTLWVKAFEKVYSPDECVQRVYDMLDFEQIRGENEKEDKIKDHLELLTHGLYETEIYWASSHRNLLDETGTLYRSNLTDETSVRLYAIIRKGDRQMLKYFDLILKV